MSADWLIERDIAPIEADAGLLEAARGIRLVAGMPAEVFLKGKQRTGTRHKALRRAARER